MTSELIPEQLIVQARGGDQAALGRLLELYRNYLRLVARSLIGAALRVKLEPSDLVQETFLKAHRDFAGFAGRSEPELVAWLRRSWSGASPTRSSTTAARDATTSGKSRSTCSWIAPTRRSTARCLARGIAQRTGRSAASRRCCWPTP